MAEPLLDVDGLTIDYLTEAGDVRLVFFQRRLGFRPRGRERGGEVFGALRDLKHRLSCRYGADVLRRPRWERAFLEASYLGWRDVMADPRSALEIFKKRVPEIDLTVIEPNMLMGLELMKTDRYAQHGIGWMDEKKMCASVELVNTYMNPPRKVQCSQVYTNEFLTRVDMPKTMR